MAHQPLHDPQRPVRTGLKRAENGKAAGGQGALIRRQGFGFAARKGKPLDQMAAPFVVHPAYQINGIANGAAARDLLQAGSKRNVFRHVESLPGKCGGFVLPAAGGQQQKGEQGYDVLCFHLAPP